MTHLSFRRQHPSRRGVLKSAALGTVATIAAPYVKRTYAAETLTLGTVDHPGADTPFVPIPEDQKPLYHFDLKKWFYASEAARQKDVKELKDLKEQVTALKPGVAQNPAKLLEAIELKQQMGIIANRLRAYGGLQYAVNTKDTAAKDEGEAAEADFDATTRFVLIAVQDLEDITLKDFMARVPNLASYAFLLNKWRRDRPHTAPEAAETLLARLEPHLDPFTNDYYDRMLARTPDAMVTIGQRELNVMKAGAYAELLRLEDRKIRERAFLKRLAGSKNQADIYAFALFHKAQLANSVAEARHFDNAVDAALFEYYLKPKTVKVVLDAFRRHASLAIRFQKAERAYQSSLLQLNQVEPWDLEARPADMPEVRFVISDASASVIEATKVFGSKYHEELTKLHDPRNGRLDIVGDANRTNGDFTWGAYGPSWVFYMQGYGGYLTDVVTLAHESAHVVHNSLLYKAGVTWYYSDGARYFTEGFAKVNELLVLDQLAKAAKTQADRLFYMRELNSKLASVKFASMYWAAYATSFEMEVYRRVKSAELKTPDDIHGVWAEFGRLWMLDFDKFPDFQYTWIGTQHFFGSARYYSNYLFAWVLAVWVYERLQNVPDFGEKLVKLMEAGFTNEPAVLLRTHLGIDLADSSALERIFAMIEKRIAEFERQI